MTEEVEPSNPDNFPAVQHCALEMALAYHRHGNTALDEIMATAKTFAEFLRQTAN